MVQILPLFIIFLNHVLRYDALDPNSIAARQSERPCLRHHVPVTTSEGFLGVAPDGHFYIRGRLEIS